MDFVDSEEGFSRDADGGISIFQGCGKTGENWAENDDFLPDKRFWLSFPEIKSD